MTILALQKEFSGIEGLYAHDFFRKTELLNDVRSGEVLAAIRKEEVHFYYRGARLCLYRTGSSVKNGSMHTNSFYLGVDDQKKSRDVRITDDWCSREKYQSIKQRCCDRRPGESELELVSQLFPEFSFCATELPDNRARLIDIEIRFPTRSGSEKTQDMIDCLFLTPGGMLVFVEVKRSSNAEARGRNTESEPAVVEQIRLYERQLSSDEARIDHIKTVYANVGVKLLAIAGVSAPTHHIRDVFRRVPLLIVGKETKPSPSSREIWQRDLLAKAPDMDGKIIALDGRGPRANNALHELFQAIDARYTSEHDVPLDRG